MSENDLMGMDLPGFTSRAASAIVKLLQSIPREISEKDVIPGVSWLFDGNYKEFEEGPAIGLSLRSDVPEEYIVCDHNLELAIYLPTHILDQVRNCQLDYVGGKFVYVTKDDS